MTGPVIRAEGIGKRYQIGSLQTGYRTLRDVMVETARTTLRRQSGDRKLDSNHIWALRDVSFEVAEGQVLGIIGPNGAGKSTLLKILARVTEPTEGYAEVTGRVGSLLEVGTGFHPELSGRENIQLNGAILGMRRAEIRRKFDEIVDFAEVEQFIDTPVKRYSTGMQLRLAFAVAAHLEPEILLVDEVLAVGDAAFQRKCLGKMGAVAQEGRTIVFVSHNMAAIGRLTEETIVVEGGRIVMRAPTPEAIDHYLIAGMEQVGERVWTGDQGAGPSVPPFTPIGLRVIGPSGEVTAQVSTAEEFAVEFEYALEESITGLRVGLYLSTSKGEPVFTTFDTDDPDVFRTWESRPAGSYISRCRIPANYLNEGRFVLGANASSFGVRSYFTDEFSLSFAADGTGAPGSQWPEPRQGPVRPALEWEILEAVK
ncbi:MAG: ABC transporter ATP-binding protein [Anaerolineales bacterium]